jgi:cation diffusion facilitator family transporter
MAEEESKTAVIGAVAANACIAVAKFIVAGITGSSAMLSEAIHSVVDTGDGLLLLLGQSRSKRPADKNHPYGHGQELYFWSFMVAVVVFAVGGGMSIYEGIHHLLEPEPLRDPSWNYVVLGISALFESISWALGMRQLRSERHGRSLWRTMRETKDPRAVAVVLEDSAALMGLVIAGGGIFFSHMLEKPALDGIASIAIGGLLATVAVVLARETKGLLLGEAADPRTLQHIKELVGQEPSVVRVGRALTMHLGPQEVLLNLEVDFRDALTAGELERVIDTLKRRIRDARPEIRHIFIELETLAPA